MALVALLAAPPAFAVSNSPFRCPPSETATTDPSENPELVLAQGAPLLTVPVRGAIRIAVVGRLPAGRRVSRHRAARMASTGQTRRRSPSRIGRSRGAHGRARRTARCRRRPRLCHQQYILSAALSPCFLLASLSTARLPVLPFWFQRRMPLYHPRALRAKLYGKGSIAILGSNDKSRHDRCEAAHETENGERVESENADRAAGHLRCRSARPALPQARGQESPAIAARPELLGWTSIALAPVDPSAEHLFLPLGTDRWASALLLAQTMTFLPRKDLLTLEEIDRLTSAFIAKGVRKIRLTGGEPLVRKNSMWLIKSLSRRSRRRPRLAPLSTDGSPDAHPVRALAERRTRINVSLDTRDPAKVSLFTRWADFDQVSAASMPRIVRAEDRAQYDGASRRQLGRVRRAHRFSYGRGVDLTLIGPSRSARSAPTDRAYLPLSLGAAARRALHARRRFLPLRRSGALR